MMSLVRAQLEEPKIRAYAKGIGSFLFLLLGRTNNMITDICSYRLSVAREVAWRLTAASGRGREVDKAQRSILSERSAGAIKIGHRKEKHDESDVAGLTPSWRSQKKRMI